MACPCKANGIGRFGQLYIETGFDGQACLRICQRAQGSLLGGFISNSVVWRMSPVEVRENTSKSAAIGLPVNDAPIVDNAPKAGTGASGPAAVDQTAPTSGP